MTVRRILFCFCFVCLVCGNVSTMLRQVELSVGWPPYSTWKRPPGRPHAKWTDQLCRDNNNTPTVTLWRQAIGRIHLTATLRSEPTTCWWRRQQWLRISQFRILPKTAENLFRNQLRRITFTSMQTTFGTSFPSFRLTSTPAQITFTMR